MTDKNFTQLAFLHSSLLPTRVPAHVHMPAGAHALTCVYTWAHMLGFQARCPSPHSPCLTQRRPARHTLPLRIANLGVPHPPRLTSAALLWGIMQHPSSGPPKRLPHLTGSHDILLTPALMVGFFFYPFHDLALFMLFEAAENLQTRPSTYLCII